MISMLRRLALKQIREMPLVRRLAYGVLRPELNDLTDARDRAAAEQVAASEALIRAGDASSLALMDFLAAETIIRTADDVAASEALIRAGDASCTALMDFTAAVRSDLTASDILEYATRAAAEGDLHCAAAMIRPVLQDVQSASIDQMASYKLGSLLAMLGEFGAANAVFSRHTELLPWASNGRMSNIIFPVDGGVRHSKLPFSRSVTSLQKSSQPAAFVYFVACDSRYAALFAEAACASLSRNAPGGLFHLHVINPDHEALEAIRRMRKADIYSIHVTEETIDISRLDDLERRAYYASARYFLAAELLNIYNSSLIIADIDQLVIKDPRDLLSGVDADVRMIRYEHAKTNLMSLHSASVLIVYPTERARVFLSNVSAYLVDIFSEPGRIGWHVDQIALTVSLLSDQQLRFAALPPTVMHNGGPADASPEEAIFWSITYSIESNHEKLRSDIFLAFDKWGCGDGSRPGAGPEHVSERN
jgi:hypothetical protein